MKHEPTGKPISRRQLIAGAASLAAMSLYSRARSSSGSLSGFGLDNPAAMEWERSRVISLAGSWRFLRNGPAPEAQPGSLPTVAFAESIQLPGTTDTNKTGPPSDERDADSLTQPYRFVGPCWCQTDIEIPGAWAGKRVALLLERTRYTQVWLDGRAVGENALLCTPQQYELGTGLTPGRHTLTVVVDNSRMPVNADAHMWSGNTQGNWNGILGRIELFATDLVWLESVQVHPDVTSRSVTIKAGLKSLTGADGEGRLSVRAEGRGIPEGVVQTTTVRWAAGGGAVEVPLSLGPAAALWDEFDPALHTLTAHLSGPAIEDVSRVQFGLREFKPREKQFAINGRPAFLRGKHDACVFPLTGFAPMDTDSWEVYFKVLRSYGLNHVRFHTWTPPEAAFDAADRVGFYLQPELPFWGSWNEQVRAALEPEARSITARLGNHPSFTMFSMGNEPWGGQPVIGELLADLHGLDNRRLYVHGTGDGHPIAGDDYTIAGDVSLDWSHPSHSVRGANAGSPFDKGHAGHVQMGPANTITDYSDAIASMPGPVISHEMGQYTVYPDFGQIAKYTGTCKPYNLERYQKILSDAGMASQAADFAGATGALAAICYREEIEACLRTPGHGGFELLDLVDYPGQGTALVGILDAFMDSKGIITPDAWRRFCSPTVLLAKFEKYAWTSNETVTAKLDVAHYGAHPLAGSRLDWALVGAGRERLAAGSTQVAAGQGVLDAGSISIPLAGMKTPVQIRLEMSLANSVVQTSYPLWIYPGDGEAAATAPLVLARAFDSKVREALLGGGAVALVCASGQPLAHTVGGAFAPDFWNFRFFFNKPGTMGLLCDPSHPALALFPTEQHSNWQWFQTALHGQPLVLDGIAPADYLPIVQVVDNYERCHKLGLIFEVSVGPGKLLVCASDLVALGETDPAARQLLKSLLDYAASSRFAPRTSIGIDRLTALLRTTVLMDGCVATASSTEPDWRGYEASQLIDGNEARGWHAARDSSGDCWCQVQFPVPVDLGGMEILWADGKAGSKFLVQTSADGALWQTVGDQSQNTTTDVRQEIPLTVEGAHYVRLSNLSVPDNSPPAIMELRFYPAQL